MNTTVFIHPWPFCNCSSARGNDTQYQAENNKISFAVYWFPVETKYYFCVSSYSNVTFKDNIENKKYVTFPQY